MRSERTGDTDRIEAAFRDALHVASRVRTTECLEPDALLGAVDAFRRDEQTEQLDHIAHCPYCRREFAELSAAISEADALRGVALGTPPTVAVVQPGSGPTASGDGGDVRRGASRFGAFLAGLWQISAFRLAMAGATAIAAALLGYVAGSGSTRVAPPGPADAHAGEALALKAQLAQSQADLGATRRHARLLEAKVTQGTARLHEMADAARSKAAISAAAPPAAPVLRSVGALGPAVVRLAMNPVLARRGGDDAVMQPGGTWVMDDRPVFRCSFPGADATTRYHLQVRPLTGSGGDPLRYEGSGRELLWHPWLRLPRGAKYTWTVRAVIAGQKCAGTATFGVLTEDEAARVKLAAGRAAGLRRARIYRAAGLLQDAAGALADLPSNPRERKSAARLAAEVRRLSTPRVEYGVPAEQPAGPEP